jgi:ABC-2 type transport system permease protein
MSELEGIYAVWLREFRVYLREKERAISSIVSPLLWLFAFGTGLGASVAIAGVNYQLFIFPGIVAMTLMFTSIFYGMYVIWDRKLDFLKEVLVAPISRRNVFLGKMLGGVTDAMIQVTVLLVLAGLLGIPITPYGALMALPAMLLITICMTSIGLFFGAVFSSFESFQLVMQFVLWPLFFFSGALFPLENLPGWLASLTYFDPLTYGVDAMRGVMLGMGKIPLGTDLLVLGIYTLVMLWMGVSAFDRKGKI